MQWFDVAALQSISDRIPLNTQNVTNGLAAAPAIALSSNGLFATWAQTPSVNSNIYLQRFTSKSEGVVYAGIPPKTLLTQQLNIDHPSGYQYSPSIAQLANGNIVAVWSGQGPSTGETGGAVFGRMFNGGGTPVGPEFLVTDDAEVGYNPVISADAHGNFVVIWWTPDNTIWGRAFTAYDTSGTPLRSNDVFQVNAAEDFGSTIPAVSMRSDGSFVVSWRTAGSSFNFVQYNYDMVVKQYVLDDEDPTGVAVVNFGEDREETIVTDPNPLSSLVIGAAGIQYSDRQSIVAHEAGEGGGFSVIWREIFEDRATKVWYRRFQVESGELTTDDPVLIADDDNEFDDNEPLIYDASIGKDGDGNVMIVWSSTKFGTGQNTLNARLVDANQTLEGTMYLGQTDASVLTSVVGFDETKRFALARYQAPTSEDTVNSADNGVFVQWFQASGSPQFTAPRKVSDLAVSTSYWTNPGLIVDDDNIVVAWASDQQTGVGSDVFMRRVGLATDVEIHGVKYKDVNANGVRDGRLIAGDPPRVVFVIDTSGSTSALFQAGPFDTDLNGTVYDASVDGFIAISQWMEDAGLYDPGYPGGPANVAIVDFSSSAAILEPGVLTSHEEVVTALTDTLPPPEGFTNYEAALQQAIDAITSESYFGIPNENEEADDVTVIFLSDGYPVPNSTNYTDEVTQLLEDIGVPRDQLRAFGVGIGASLTHLRNIDPDATIFRSRQELIDAFGGFDNTLATDFEPPLPGWTMYIDLNNNGVRDANEPTSVTDEQGEFSFVGLAPRSEGYIVREVLQPGWRQTGPVEPGPGQTYPFVVQLDQPGMSASNLMFGNLDDALINSAPEFTSDPVTVAYVGTPYHYESTATDPENDPLTFGMGSVTWPDGFAPPAANQFNFVNQTFDPQTGLRNPRGIFTWNAPVELVGQTVTIVETVTDSFGNQVTRPIQIRVEPGYQNQPPVITTADPPDEFTLPQEAPPNTTGDVTPQSVTVSLADGERVTIPVSVRPTSGGGGEADIVFLLDSSGSMSVGFQWLADVVLPLDDALQAAGIAARYGLTTYDVAPEQHTFGTGHSEWGTALDVRNEVLNDGAFGPTENGYEALDFVLNNYSWNGFTAGYARQIVLISDQRAADWLDFNDGQGKDRFLNLGPEYNSQDVISLENDPAVDFDDIILNVVVPAFYSGELPNGNTAVFTDDTGSWAYDTDLYTGVAGAANQWATSVSTTDLSKYAFDNALYYQYGATMRIEDRGAGYQQDAALIFAYESPTDFKFVAGFADEDKWRIGHVSGGVTTYDAEASMPIATGQDYQVIVQFSGGTNTYLIVDNQYITSFNFEGSTSHGPAGMGTLGGKASFDDFGVYRFGYIGEQSAQAFFDFGTDGHVFPVIGYLGDSVYFPDTQGGFILGANPQFVYQYEDDKTDYIDLAEPMGGSVWNQAIMRTISIGADPPDPLAESFSTSLAHAIVTQSLRQILAGIAVQAGEGGQDVFVGAEFDPDATDISTGQIAFNVTLEGDGLAHSFDLEFAFGDTVLDTLPTRVSSPYVLDLDAMDPDNDVPLTFSWCRAAKRVGTPCPWRISRCWSPAGATTSTTSTIASSGIRPT